MNDAYEVSPAATNACEFQEGPPGYRLGLNVLPLFPTRLPPRAPRPLSLMTPAARLLIRPAPLSVTSRLPLFGLTATGAVGRGATVVLIRGAGASQTVFGGLCQQWPSQLQLVPP